jgi:lipopolysaccharide/colanic/teichoic acid biosynthesis glycosyltransferase
MQSWSSSGTGAPNGRWEALEHHGQRSTKGRCPGCYRGKRVLDVLILSSVAPVVVPVALLCALAVRLTSRGPVLFRQERVGRGGAPFELLKFRTMVHDPARVAGFPDQDAITAVGRWLRRLSLDELPQLLNVLRGDMCVVGPRPTLAYQVERYTDRQRARLAVPPGLTGWAQVHGRNHLSWADRIELDVEYVRRQSLWLDLQILARTPPAVVTGSGTEGHPLDDPIARREAA